MITLKIVDLDLDYNMLAAWWKAHGMSIPGRSMLPKLGVLAYHNNIPAAAAWAYLDNSTPVAIVTWQVTNPSNTPKVSAKALDEVIEFICKTISDFGDGTGYGAVIAISAKPSSKRMLERHKFKEFYRSHTGMIRMNKEEN